MEGNRLIGNRHEDGHGTVQQLIERAETAFGTDFYYTAFDELTNPSPLGP